MYRYLPVMPTSQGTSVYRSVTRVSPMHAITSIFS